ncbi:Hypothetical protein (Fragment), partial [Durusdinium trenchii]
MKEVIMASGADEGRSVIGTDLSIRFRSRHVRLPAERLAILLQKLCREVRGSVLGRLEEWQRLELEQELLRKLKSGASFMKADEDRGKCALPTSPVATKPSEVIPPRPPKRPSQKVKRKVLCNARENQGIFRRQTAGGEKFRAGIGFCNLRLQARPRSSIRDARKDLDCLVGLRDQVLLHHGPFEDRVRTALGSPETWSDNDATLASRRITLQVASSGLCRQVLLSPAYKLPQLDVALAAWRRLRDAQRTGLKPELGGP